MTNITRKLLAIYGPARFQTLTAFLAASLHFLVVRELFTCGSTKVTRLRTALAHHDATRTAPSAELSAGDAAGRTVQTTF